MSSHEIALQVLQQAVYKLLLEADISLPQECNYPEDCKVIARAKQLCLWNESAKIQPLRSLFDLVKLEEGQKKIHYWKYQEIANEDPSLPYPREEKPTANDLEKLKTIINQDLSQIDLKKSWNNLSFLTIIIEKYGSFISLGEAEISFADQVISTAAVATALANDINASHLSLIAGDLSGIQKFIYTISSEGALKSLRARSFYLELVTEEVVQQVLEVLGLPRTSIIYAGGGNLYILASSEQIEEAIAQVRTELNEWLLQEFQGKVFLALDSLKFETEDIKSTKFAEHWSTVTKKLSKQKLCKFVDQINNGKLLEKTIASDPCKVCHRDDDKKLKPLSQEEESVLACPTCHLMFELGSRLFQMKGIIRSKRKNLPGTLSLKTPLHLSNNYYHLFDNLPKMEEIEENEIVFLVNTWRIAEYQTEQFRPLLLGNYGKKSEIEENNFIRAGEMAKQAKGINRMGYLRMDVDNLGQIFAKGLGEKQTLPRIAGISRQMSYFFKVYLNSLAKDCCNNLPKKAKNLYDGNRQNLLFIYAGGDDLFVSGSWNEIVDLGFDVYQCFRAYTGYNPDLTISAGISLASYKFPLYQAAKESGEAEEAAKSNGRDSLGLFGQVFKWDEWLGQTHVDLIEKKEKEYWEQVPTKPNQPKLLGILPFVYRLEQQNIGLDYSRNFVRNLLKTAQLQEQMIKEIRDKRKIQKYQHEINDIQYYLHLPQIAYTLARLPSEVLNDDDFRTSLKSPYNAPYFRAIATWIELLNRQESHD